MGRRLAIIFALVLVTIALFGTMGWRAWRSHETGWVGLRFFPGQPKELTEKIGWTNPMMGKAGSIDVVVDGAPGWRAGIRPGDVITTINGVPVDRTRRLHELSDKIRRGDTVTYQLVRDGKERTVRVATVSPLSLPIIVAGIAVNTFIALAYISIAVLVYWHKPRSRRAWVFLWLCVAGGMSFLSASYIDLDILGYDGIQPFMSRGDSLLLYVVVAVIATLMSALLLHLSLVFPKELPIVQRHPAVVRSVYSVAALPFAMGLSVIALAMRSKVVGMAIVTSLVAIALTFIALRIRRVWSGKFSSLLLDHPITSQAGAALLFITLALAALPFMSNKQLLAFILITTVLLTLTFVLMGLVYPLLTLVALVMGYRRSSIEEKRQVRWPLWGTGLAICLTALATVGFFCASQFNQQADSTTIAVLTSLTRLAFLLIPLSFAFGILKHRLMEIDVIIKKTVVYSAVTGVIVAAFFVLVAGVGSVITSSLQIRSQTVTVIATLGLALAFVPLRNRVQRFVDRRFFRRRYESSEAEKLIQHEVLEATELQPVLRKIAEYVQQVLQLRSVVILTPAESGRFVPTGAIGVADEVLRGLSIERDALPRADRTGPASSLRLSQDDWVRVRKMSAELVVPAMRRGELLGMMIVGSMLSGSFDEDDHAFLESVAQQIAAAVANLTVGDEVRDYERALEIQRALLPRTIPTVEGVDIDAEWKPAKIVGGDYFDVLQLSPTTLGLCIADVAGKGMPAALLMANLQAAVKASATDQLSPSEVCVKVRNVVCGTLSGGRFVTFFYAMLDTTRMLLRYVNAGHNPALLLKADGRVVRLDAGGPAFARLMQTGTYRTSDVQLGEGDTLVLFTDGVTEARSATEEEFGEDRLTSVVRAASPSARHVVRAITENVREFSGGVAHDDVTIVCLRVTRGGVENLVPFPRAAG